MYPSLISKSFYKRIMLLLDCIQIYLSISVSVSNLQSQHNNHRQLELMKLTVQIQSDIQDSDLRQKDKIQKEILSPCKQRSSGWPRWGATNTESREKIEAYPAFRRIFWLDPVSGSMLTLYSFCVVYFSDCLYFY